LYRTPALAACHPTTFFLFIKARGNYCGFNLFRKFVVARKKVQEMLFEYQLTMPREDFYNITTQVREAVAKSGVTDGIAVVYCPLRKTHFELFLDGTCFFS
jgi:hypothetical protein